jgi:hypothetical protein
VAHHVVEPGIAEDHRVGLDDRDREPPAARTARAAHLEQVGEVAGVEQIELDAQRPVAEIAHRDALVARGLPEELGAHDVQRVARQVGGGGEDLGVGEIDGEHRIIVLHRGAQQQRPPAVEQQLQARQVARVRVVEAVGAGLAAHDVAVAVEHREGVAVLEHARAALEQRRRGGDGELRFVMRLGLLGEGADHDAVLPAQATSASEAGASRRLA